MFLTKISFDTVYNPILTQHYKRVSNIKYYREIKVETVESREGVIVGSCFKFDGYYEKGIKPSGFDSYDGQSPWFSATKRIDFWEVYVSMNEMYLVPKKEPENHRFEPNQDEYKEPEQFWDDEFPAGF